MQTDLRLGSKVEGQNGQALGEIKHLVMGQNNQQVTHIVVGGSAYGQGLKLVEVGKVGQIGQDKDTVRLNMSQEQFQQLPDFDERKFMESRGYPLNDSKPNDPGDAKNPQELVGGGYNLNADTNLNPPGIVDNQSH